jgi:hypothetical protein
MSVALMESEMEAVPADQRVHGIQSRVAEKAHPQIEIASWAKREYPRSCRWD